MPRWEQALTGRRVRVGSGAGPRRQAPVRDDWLCFIFQGRNNSGFMWVTRISRFSRSKKLCLSDLKCNWVNCISSRSPILTGGPSLLTAQPTLKGKWRTVYDHTPAKG
ncbi:unnamed protein product [Rangifer tarandus platyrhynchus]|uniref:Uncharacterized protein n=2 Tax=Rangifer tarandus platyrhynchus TaxID=3082113 RepID=A0AC59Z698_RANTA|nr:unnamed protein product [Rangifer tarandus platyrhynchus]